MSVPGTRCSVRCRRRSSMGRVCILRLSLGRWGQYTGVRDGTVGPILRSRAMALLLNKLDLSVGALRITILSLGISPASVVDQVSEAVIVLLHCSAKFCASSNPGTYVTIQGIIGGGGESDRFPLRYSKECSVLLTLSKLRSTRRLGYHESTKKFLNSPNLRWRISSSLMRRYLRPCQ